MAYDLSTFADLVTDVMNRARVTSQDAEQKNRVKRFINARYQDIQAAEDWSWVRAEAAISVPQPLSVGNLTLTNGSITISCDESVFLDGMDGNWILKIGGIDDIYRISRYVSATSAELSTAFVGDTETTSDYTLYQDIFDLEADTEEIIRMYHNQPHGGLEAFHEIPPNDMRLAKYGDIVPDSEAWYWSLALPASDGTKRVEIYPYNPENAYIIYYEYTKDIASLDADADVPVIPKRYRSILVYAALADFLESLGQDKAAGRAEARARGILGQMVRKDAKARNRPKMYHRLKGLGPSVGFLRRHSGDYFDKY